MRARAGNASMSPSPTVPAALGLPPVSLRSLGRAGTRAGR